MFVIVSKNQDGELRYFQKMGIDAFPVFTDKFYNARTYPNDSGIIDDDLYDLLCEGYYCWKAEV